MNVMNRKLFANRDARRKLANMGGIIASSPELLGTAQRFREGGKAMTFGRNKLVVFDDGEIYIELPNGDRKKLEGAQLQQAQQIVSSRPEANKAYLDSVLSRGASATTPAVSALEETETISEEAAKQMAVLSKARAGNSLAQIAKDTFLDTADVANIIAGSAGLLVNELASLTGDVLSIVTGAINEDVGKAFGRKAEDLRSGGRDLLLKEGKILPRVFDVDFAGGRREEIEQNLRRTLGTTVTPEQRAAIQEQSLAAIERASPETLRDTGESVGITGRARLPNVQADVTTSVGGLGSTPTSDQVGMSPTGRFTGVKTMSGYGDSGIMSQTPRISVPDVATLQSGLEDARQEANLRRFIATENPEFYNPLAKEMGQRAREYYDTDTFTPPSEIYSDYLGGDPRAIAKYQGATPEEVQAVSDRLAREAAADEAAKEQGFFTEQDQAIQTEQDSAADAAALEDLKTTAEEIEEKTEKVEPKETTTEPGKVEPGDRGFTPADIQEQIDTVDKKVKKEIEKPDGGNANAVASSGLLQAAGVDTSNMGLKERVQSMQEMMAELVGYDDDDEKKEFWLTMAGIGFQIASGQSSKALVNIAEGLAQGAKKFAENQATRQSRKDKLTLTALGEVLADDRAAAKFERDKELAGIRASATSPYGKRTDPLTLAFRLADNAVKNYEFDSIDQALEHFKGVVGREYGIDLGGTINSDYKPKTAEELNTAAINRGDKTFVYNGQVYPVVTS